MANWSQADFDAHFQRLRGHDVDKPAKKSPNKPKFQQQTNVEAQYEESLRLRTIAGEIIRYYFHPCRFHLANRCTYEPDFMVQYADGQIDFLDTKGTKGDRYWCEEDAKIKIKFAAQTYPLFGWAITWKLKNGEWKEERF